MQPFPLYVMAKSLENTVFIFRENGQEIPVRLDYKRSTEWDLLTDEEAEHLNNNFIKKYK